MNIPQFSAEASLYRTTRQYRSSISEYRAQPATPYSVFPAYMPGPATQRDCSVCTGSCDKLFEVCGIGVVAGVSAVCVATLGFGCPAAVAAGEAVLVGCAEAYAACIGYCNVPGWVPVVGGYCCPKICGPPNPLEGSGSGCCDLGEACVDQDDPNSRQGCCPSGQLVCGGKCCAVGDQCCGDTCCPPNYFCREGGFCSEFPSDLGPPAGTPPPLPPQYACSPGSAPCGFADSSGVIRTCCPPGLQCCGYSGRFGPDCRKSCLH